MDYVLTALGFTDDELLILAAINKITISLDFV